MITIISVRSHETCTVRASLPRQVEQVTAAPVRAAKKIALLTSLNC